jgi:hypothetical protein
MDTRSPAARIQTKTQWRREGRGIRRDAEPDGLLHWNGRYVGLYREKDTTQFRSYTVARNYLVDLFAGYPDTFGYTSKKDGCVYRADPTKLKGGARGVIEGGFNYRRCAAGISMGKYMADRFHVPAGASVRYRVVDLDNHAPTRQGTEVHLELVQRLQERLPTLAKRIGVKSSFWQYRGIEPTGIQLWLILHGERPRQRVDAQIRDFLLSLGDHDLDMRLRSCGLPGLGNIEILPGENLVSMPGCYGKLVFTDRELKITDQRFDCESLYQHISGARQAGAVHERYRELSLVRDFPFTAEDPLPVPACETKEVPLRRMNIGKGYWSKLKETCLRGIDLPDQLHGLFLKPVAEALLFREFHDRRDKQELAFQAIRKWVLKKHNGCVSRITDHKFHLVESQIRSTIKNLFKKPNQKVLDYYARIRLNDSRFPNTRESLLPYMEGEGLPFFLNNCKGVISEHRRTEAKPVEDCLKHFGLPERVAERLQEYAAMHIRPGRATQRFMEFATRFIAEVGPDGDRQINERTLLGLTGKEADYEPATLKRWKRHLVAAGILCDGWEKNVIRGLRSSRYRLQWWVKEELDAMSTSQFLRLASDPREGLRSDGAGRRDFVSEAETSPPQKCPGRTLLGQPQERHPEGHDGQEKRRERE